MHFLENLKPLSWVSILLAFAPAFAFAKPNPMVEETVRAAISNYIADVRVPDQLFHWTSHDDLLGMTPRNRVGNEGNFFYGDSGERILTDGSQLPLVRLDGTVLTKLNEIPSYGLFTSANPVAGMGTDLENYTQAKMVRWVPEDLGLLERFFHQFTDKYLVAAYPPRLITMKPKKSASFSIVVTTVEYDSTENSTVKVLYKESRGTDRPDLVYHLHLDTFNPKKVFVVFQEWVVLNADSISWFGADPELARKRIESELKKFEDRNFEYKPHEKAISQQPLPKHFKKILNSFLEGGRDRIPPFFLGVTSEMQSENCNEIMNYLGP